MYTTLTHIRAAFQLSGTGKLTAVKEVASHLQSNNEPLSMFHLRSNAPGWKVWYQLFNIQIGEHLSVEHHSISEFTLPTQLKILTAGLTMAAQAL